MKATTGPNYWKTIGASLSMLTFANPTLVEGGYPATLCPVLIKHSDCDGQWTPEEASLLLREFDLIQTAFSNAPPMAFNVDWKKRVAKETGIDPDSFPERPIFYANSLAFRAIHGTHTLSAHE
ncbi:MULTISPECIES: hypothetical protein [unclassified Paraburkholderia]|uniref:hypothetical protein n=1 Tax=unclassified Paraburkholderia TaxID=2615204 RepID=UPI002AB15735|nr:MULTISPECIES: hypothetical protein [unclassified Paraburkholderia]